MCAHDLHGGGMALMITNMDGTVTIDGVGRLVIPKAIRERLHLVAGTSLHIREQDGRIVLSPERSEPTLVERGGFLAIDVGGEMQVESEDVRAQRLRGLVDYAMRR